MLPFLLQVRFAHAQSSCPQVHGTLFYYPKLHFPEDGTSGRGLISPRGGVRRSERMLSL